MMRLLVSGFELFSDLLGDGGHFINRDSSRVRCACLRSRRPRALAQGSAPVAHAVGVPLQDEARAHYIGTYMPHKTGRRSQAFMQARYTSGQQRGILGMDAAPLGHWDSFYVIVGSSAAALTGLQFVVMALAADAPVRTATSETVGAFGTPTVVHFSVVLLASAILSAPWHSIENAAIAIGACGLAGVVYGLIIVRRAPPADWL